MKASDRVPFREKVCYGIGSMGGNLPNYMVVGYLTLFATDVMGVNAAAIGLIILIGSFLDAITDLLVTNFADRTQTRWGKYRPWLLYTGVPAALIFVLLFWYPAFLVTEGAKLLWLFAGYFLLSPIFLTGYMCPQFVMLSLITPDENERLSLGSARSMGEFVSDLVINGLCMTLILWLGNGNYRSVQAWRMTALLFAALSAAACLIGFLGSRERVHISNEDSSGHRLSLGVKIKTLLKSKVYFKTLVLNSGMILAAVETVLISYFCIYNLGHAEWLSPICIAASVASLAASMLIPVLGKWWRKRGIITFGCVTLFVAAGVCMSVNSFASAILFAVLKGLGYGLCITCCGIVWTDTADHVEEQSGLAIPGLVMASGSFVSKVLMGLCAYIGTWILTLGHYDETLAVQAPETLLWIRAGMAVFIVLGAVITLAANLSLHEFSEKGELV